MITVACVFKLGGWPTEKYVRHLKRSVEEHLPIPHRFVCLTDSRTAVCETEPLTFRWPGWWSKLELFDRFKKDPVIFFDLDTLIMGDLTPLAQLTEDVDHCLYMLSPLTKRDVYGSGVMVWKGDYSFLSDNFNPGMHIDQFEWDQRYICDQLVRYEVGVQGLQQQISGIYSYKLDALRAKPPVNGRIILFHGRPRPHEVLFLGWVKKLWRGDE